MRRRLKPYVLGAGALAVAALLVWLFASRGPLAPIEVSTAAVAQTELRPEIFGIGTVDARLAYSIGPTQAGRVLAVHVDHGDQVKAGQVLAQIDPVDLQQRLEGTEAAAARANQAVLIAAAQAREAETRERLAQANARRYHDLARQRFVAQELADNRGSEADMASSARAATLAAVEAARRDAARAALEREAIQRQLANLTLVSPVDGVVIARDAEPGTTVVAGQAVVRVVDPGSLWVRARIDQAQASGLRAGLPAQIVLRSAHGVLLPGRIARIELSGDAVTEERIVAVEFAQAPSALYLGELAEVTIQLPALADVATIPSAAIRQNGGQRGVWRIAAGRARFVPVTTGIQTLDGQIEIRHGLEPGDAVIVHSQAQLQEGVKVRAKPSLS